MNLNLTVIIGSFKLYFCPMKTDQRKTEFNLDLMDAEALKNQIIVFDFDGTLIEGDCSEEMFKELMKQGKLTSENLKNVSLMDRESELDPFEYYQSLLQKHQGDEDYVEGHLWMVKALGELNLEDVLLAAKKAFEPKDQKIKFNTEILNVLEKCMAAGAKCLVLSASPEVVVKFLVQKYLNPLLEKKNLKPVDLKNVRGIEFKNASEFEVVGNKIHWEDSFCHVLGRELLYPAPSGKGKALFLEKNAKQKPLFSFSDSSTDFPLLEAAQTGVIVLQKGDKSWDTIGHNFYLIS